MSSDGPRPIIIVTGANSGVGFGICHRLLVQSSSRGRQQTPDGPELNFDGLTLVLACRSKQRAEVARAKLYSIADEQVRRAKCSSRHDGHAGAFRRNLHITIHTVDLANIESVFHFADEIVRNYPYVSHLICNAGVAPFLRIDWLLAVRQLLQGWVSAVTSPKFFLQRAGEISQDGLGWVWQCNVFGHYGLFRALEPMLAKHTAPRVVWISSHEASSEFYNPKDWQLVKSQHPYECSKYQMNMISLCLDREAARGQRDDTPAARHFIAYPGVVGTSIATAVLGTFQRLGMYMSFYIARFMGSPNHTIDIFKAAISAVYLTFTCITYLPRIGKATTPTGVKESVGESTVYASKTNWLGHEYVESIQISQSEEEEAHAKELLDNCDRLLKTFCDAQGRTSPSG